MIALMMVAKFTTPRNVAEDYRHSALSCENLKFHLYPSLKNNLLRDVNPTHILRVIEMYSRNKNEMIYAHCRAYIFAAAKRISYIHIRDYKLFPGRMKIRRRCAKLIHFFICSTMPRGEFTL